MKYSTILAGAAVAAASFVAADRAEDIVILQYALTLEHLEAAFYKDALTKFSVNDFKNAGFPAAVPQRLAQIGSQEATHVTALSGILTSLGVTPTEACTYNFNYNTIPEFLQTARVLEGVGVGAYLYKAPLIDDKAYLAAAAAIVTVEARHQALISSFLGEDGTPSPFDTALQGSQVLTLAAPFLNVCPATNPVLPFKTFPALGIKTAMPQIGQKVEFQLPKDTKGTIYLHFLNGLADTVVGLKSDSSVTLPEGLTGTVYVVATRSTGPVNDDNTVAGPAIIQLGAPDAQYPKARRSLTFAA